MNIPERVAVLEPNDSLSEKIFGLVAKHCKDCACTQFKSYDDLFRDRNAYDIFVFNEEFYLQFLRDETFSAMLADSAQRSYVLTDVDGSVHQIFILRRHKTSSDSEIAAKIDAAEDEFLRELFIKLGFRHNLTGCRYLKAAIKLTSRDSSYLNKGITKRLYPKLAEMFDSNPSSIERGIRHALSVCFDNGKFKAQSAVFGNCFDSCHCPTNGEFIALVADMLSTKIKSMFSNKDPL